ncbi:hypothetical protein [Streptomyces sp. CC53]|uniref:hypothetical protein n=1 Tax=Streptomyces sp. CC53 TaxID=1906740 RepID=UPI000ADE6B6C|nr:hypothetical protein [Streptomyces sp. CC53]
MPDDLYHRYMKALAASRAHDATCTTCTRDALCADGSRLEESFTRLQDAYLTRLREQRS